MRGPRSLRARCRRGATAIEYALIGAVISVSIIGGAMLMRDAMVNNYETVALRVDEALAY